MFMCVCRDNHQSSSRHNLDLHENVVAGGEGDTDEDEEEVGDGEVQDQQVRCVLHLRVRHHLLQGGGGEKAKTNCELAWWKPSQSWMKVKASHPASSQCNDGC